MAIENDMTYQSKLLEIGSDMEDAFGRENLQENSAMALEVLYSLKAVVERPSLADEPVLICRYVDHIPIYVFYNAHFQKGIFPDLTGTVAARAFYGARSAKYLDLGKCSKLEGGFIIQSSSDPILDTLVLRKTDGVVTLTSAYPFTYTKLDEGEGYIYVPDELVENYKVANNWAIYSSLIKGLSELPEQEVQE